MESPSTHLSLLLLLLLASGEDPEAWQVFHERYGELIRDYGRRRGLQASDCDDLLQTVLLSLTKALPAFRYDPEKGSLRGYLKTIALRAIFKRFGSESPADRPRAAPGAEPRRGRALGKRLARAPCAPGPGALVPGLPGKNIERISTVCA